MSGRVQQPGGKSWSSNIIGDWAAEASCRSYAVSPDWWFPTAASGRPGSRSRWGGDAQQAIRVCRACPVVMQCLEHALRNGEPDGIWGGLLPDERDALNPAPPPALSQLDEINHGTEGGWKAHKRRGQVPCERCRNGAVIAQRERRIRRERLVTR